MKKITLTRVGNIVLIRPWVQENPVFDELADELTCDRRVRHPMGFFETRTHEMFDIDSNEDGECCMMTYGGFFPRIIKHFRSHRVKIKVIDKQEFLPVPDLSKLPPLRKRQPEAIAAIVSAARGLVVCPTAFGKTFIIKMLCLLYPEMNILVVSRKSRVVTNLYNKISEAVDGPVAHVFGKVHWPKEAKIAVTTIASLHKFPETWPDILLFDEAHNAASYDASVSLSRYLKTKMFGFTATPEGRGDNTDLITEAFFGERICDISYQEARRDGTVSQITALFVKIDVPDIDTDGMSTMDKNKEGYWWNEIRNRRLLAAAEKYLRPDETALYYVQNTEHALYLRFLRPDLPIAHGGISPQRWKKFLAKGLVTEEDAALKKPDLDKLEKQFRAGEIKRVISTSSWKEGVDFPDLAGLVRFDGGAAPIDSQQIVGRLSRIGEDGKKTNALVIDAEDCFGRRYKSRSGSRRRAYKKNGWKIVKLWK